MFSSRHILISEYQNSPACQAPVKRPLRGTGSLLVYNTFLNGDWKRQRFFRPSPERLATPFQRIENNTLD